MTRSDITESAADSSAARRAAPQRSDAQHNHERILAIAREALAASADASLNSIAKEAGIGPGTLYRHFPNREALVLAVYEEDVLALASKADELLAQHEPVKALRVWFDCLAAYAASKHSLAGALRTATSDDRADTTYGLVIGALARLLSACQQDGSIRSDIEPGDVLLLLGSVWRIQPGPNAHVRVARLLDLIAGALQAEASRNTSQSRRRRSRRPLRLPRRLALISFSAPRSL